MVTTRVIHVSEKAFAVIMSHAHANGETGLQAVDELVAVADQAWQMDMPEMKTPWAKFKAYMKEM